jgi:hypothetical protein
MGLRVLRRWPSHGLEGSPPNSDVCLGGGERGTDLALGAACLVMSALPWTTSALGQRLGHLMDLGTHGGVCGLATEGRRLVDLGMKVVDRSAPRGTWIQSPRSTVSSDGGPAPLSIDGEWAWATISGGIRRWHPVGIGGLKP